MNPYFFIWQIYAVSITIRIVVSFPWKLQCYKWKCVKCILPLACLIWNGFCATARVYVADCLLEIWLPSFHGSCHCHSQWRLALLASLPLVIYLKCYKFLFVCHYYLSCLLFDLSFCFQVLSWPYPRTESSLLPSLTVGSSVKFLLLVLFLVVTWL